MERRIFNRCRSYKLIQIQIVSLFRKMERGISFAFYLNDPEKYKDIKIELVLNLDFL